MVQGGSLGPPADEVIRIGHMGAQADLVLIDRRMDVLARVPSRGRDTGAKKVI
jgi:aspartate aminotransferase-like enzyme